MWKVKDKEKVKFTTSDGYEYLCTFGNPNGLLEVYKGYGGVKLFGKVLEGNYAEFVEAVKANTSETILNVRIDTIKQDDDSGRDSLRQRIEEIRYNNQDSYEKIGVGPP